MDSMSSDERLRYFADNFEWHGLDISQWGSLPSIINALRTIASELKQYQQSDHIVLSEDKDREDNREGNIVLDKGLFRAELEALINKYSMENNSNTPDFILADYMVNCLDAYEIAARRRTDWYNKNREVMVKGDNNG